MSKKDFQHLAAAIGGLGPLMQGAVNAANEREKEMVRELQLTDWSKFDADTLTEILALIDAAQDDDETQNAE